MNKYKDSHYFLHQIWIGGLLMQPVVHVDLQSKSWIHRDASHRDLFMTLEHVLLCMSHDLWLQMASPCNAATAACLVVRLMRWGINVSLCIFYLFFFYRIAFDFYSEIWYKMTVNWFPWTPGKPHFIFLMSVKVKGCCQIISSAELVPGSTLLTIRFVFCLGLIYCRLHNFPPMSAARQNLIWDCDIIGSHLWRRMSTLGCCSTYLWFRLMRWVYF